MHRLIPVHEMVVYVYVGPGASVSGEYIPAEAYRETKRIH